MATTRQGKRRTGMVRAQIDPELKAEAEAVLAEMGMSVTDAIRVYYRQIALSKGLPFDGLIPNAETAQSIRDTRAGIGVTQYASVDDLFAKLGY